MLKNENYRKHANNIPGWFNKKDKEAYLFLLNQVKENGIFVECGAWLGRSSSFLCDMARKDIKIYIVDTWKGSPDELDTTHKLTNYQTHQQ